jgi:proto-oncogene tyrosine-protein kinase Ret
VIFGLTVGVHSINFNENTNILGVCLWEVMTLGGTPYPTITMSQLYNLLKDGYRMEAPHNCPEEIYGVMIMCWQEKPESRPQFQVKFIG